jgi:hypothetical protein
MKRRIALWLYGLGWRRLANWIYPVDLELVAKASFEASNLSGYGKISARRERS